MLVERSSYEEHPLGRMEWIKLYGALLGLEEEAEKLFDTEVAAVEALGDQTETGKTVAFFYINAAGTVNVRKSSDYVPRMIDMAGGTYIFPDLESGSALSTVNMTMEAFYNDAKDADIALKSFIDYYLDDLHSVFNEFSYLAGLNPIERSTGIANRKLDAHVDVYGAARKAAYPDGFLQYEEVGNTAYITFDTFDSDYYAFAYYAAREEEKQLDDTVAQIIDAHARITRENSPIENVVLDLSNNTGGAVDAAVVVLSWFLGDAPFSVKNTATGAMSTAVYRADINLDHVFDEHDTVADKNLYCLISPVSFSCGNLVPAALKSSQKVTLIGRTTGGGSCSVQPMTTAYGTVFQVSSAMQMSFLKNGSFYDIDQGVEPDYYINNIANYYNREALTNFINNLF